MILSFLALCVCFFFTSTVFSKRVDRMMRRVLFFKATDSNHFGTRMEIDWNVSPEMKAFCWPSLNLLWVPEWVHHCSFGGTVGTARCVSHSDSGDWSAVRCARLPRSYLLVVCSHATDPEVSTVMEWWIRVGEMLERGERGDEEEGTKKGGRKEIIANDRGKHWQCGHVG